MPVFISLQSFYMLDAVLKTGPQAVSCVRDQKSMQSLSKTPGFLHKGPGGTKTSHFKYVRLLEFSV